MNWTIEFILSAKLAIFSLCVVFGLYEKKSILARKARKGFVQYGKKRARDYFASATLIAAVVPFDCPSLAVDHIILLFLMFK